MTRLTFKKVIAIGTLLFGVTSDGQATTISGTVWCADGVTDCGSNQLPGPERLAGLRVALCDEDGDTLVRSNGEPLIDTTDANGGYRFSGLLDLSPRTTFYVKLLDVPQDKPLGSINCLNTRNEPGTQCLELPGEYNPAPCGEVNLEARTIVIDVSAVSDEHVCETFINGIDFVLCCDEEEPEQLCWMTGGGVKFDSVSNVWSAEMRTGRGPRDSVGGVVAPSCSPFPSNGGQWNHVAHGLKLHLIGQDITVLRCGNVEGIEPGTESPVCGVNFIEFEGVGRLQGIGSNRIDPIDVSFFGRVEDRNEPGNEQSATSGEDIDRYFLRVVDGDGTVHILVDVDGDPDSVDPLTITGGNFQIHCTSCDEEEAGGASLSADRSHLPHEVGRLFLRGDSNFDGQLDVADPIHSLSFLFQNGSRPICLDAADRNDDGVLDLSDPILSLRSMFTSDAGGAGSLFEPVFDTTHDFSVCELGGL